jgi:HemY protein
MAVLKWLLALALTVPLAFVGWLLARDPGRLSLRAWGWQIDTTLVLALAMLAILGFVAWLLYWLLWRLPVKLLARRQRHLNLQFRHGLEDFAQGRYAKAKRRLLAASAVSENAPLALLYAAFASQQLGENKQAAELAERASRFEEVKAAADVLATQIKLQAGDLSQLETLQSMAQGAQHPMAAPTLVRALSERGRAREAMNVMRELAQKTPGDARASASDWAAMARLALSQAATADALAEVWALLSTQEREQHDVIAAYAHSANRLGQTESAEKVLRGALKQSASELLWQEYAETCASLGTEQRLDALKFIEKSLSATSPHESPSALLAAAILCRKQDLHAKAAQYLERSMALSSSRAALIEQGELCFLQGDHLAATQAFRAALAMG